MNYLNTYYSIHVYNQLYPVYYKQLNTYTMTHTLYFDGACRGNPGNGSFGGVIYDDKQNIVTTYNDFLGITTNNIAEYSALLNGLQIALEHDITNIDVYGDSLLIIKQMNGLFKVRNKRLRELNEECNTLKQKFKHITFQHILRDKNKIADKLANEALDTN